MQNNSQKYCHLLDLQAPSSFQSSESVVCICYTRELFLKISQSSRKTPALNSLFDSLQLF